MIYFNHCFVCHQKCKNGYSCHHYENDSDTFYMIDHCPFCEKELVYTKKPVKLECESDTHSFTWFDETITGAVAFCYSVKENGKDFFFCHLKRNQNIRYCVIDGKKELFHREFNCSGDSFEFYVKFCKLIIDKSSLLFL